MAETNRWFRILNAEFDHSSDRSCAIVAAASLEELLENIIRARLVANSSSQDTLFDSPNAPIASFSAKIDFAFRLGLVSHRLAHDCHMVRRIRNKFAHQVEGASFTEADIQNQVHELVQSHNEEGRINELLTHPYDTVRGRFIMITILIVSHLDAAIKKDAKRIEPLTLEAESLYTCEYTVDRSSKTS
jgi:DNA-binding MltR family transcriptional regulator